MNFTPTVSAPRFCCPDVVTTLPTTFQDALSHYEVLCRLVAKMNEVIRQSNSTAGGFEALVKQFNELSAYVDKYFSDLSVQEEVNAKIEELLATGEFADLVQLALDDYEKTMNLRLAAQDQKIEGIANISAFGYKFPEMYKLPGNTWDDAFDLMNKDETTRQVFLSQAYTLTRVHALSASDLWCTDSAEIITDNNFTVSLNGNSRGVLRFFSRGNKAAPVFGVSVFNGSVSISTQFSNAATLAFHSLRHASVTLATLNPLSIPPVDKKPFTVGIMEFSTIKFISGAGSGSVSADPNPVFSTSGARLHDSRFILYGMTDAPTNLLTVSGATIWGRVEISLIYANCEVGNNSADKYDSGYIVFTDSHNGTATVNTTTVRCIFEQSVLNVKSIESKAKIILNSGSYAMDFSGAASKNTQTAVNGGNAVFGSTATGYFNGHFAKFYQHYIPNATVELEPNDRKVVFFTETRPNYSRPIDISFTSEDRDIVPLWLNGNQTPVVVDVPAGAERIYIMPKSSATTSDYLNIALVK